MRPGGGVARSPAVSHLQIEMSAAEHLMDEAVAAWLSGASAAVSPTELVSPTEEGEVSVTGPTVRQPAGGGEPVPADSGIRVSALSGHSPSARALVNASDTVARLAAIAAAEPPATLRSRVLAAASARKPAASNGRPPAPVTIEIPGIGRLTSPNELLGRLHQ